MFRGPMLRHEVDMSPRRRCQRLIPAQGRQTLRPPRPVHRRIQLHFRSATLNRRLRARKTA
jgi:hypothetical protein